MKRILIIALVLFPFIINGQDIHFSQFNMSPLNLNPATTGNFDGDYRLNANQRSQWKSVSNPYRTFAFAGDARDLFKINNVGAGINIFNDRAGTSQFGTLQINLSGAYTIPISGDDHSLTLAAQSGFTQRKINPNDLTFDNQWNGSRHDATLGSGENFANNGRNYANLHSGVYWFRKLADRKTLNGGVAFHNITKPLQSFYGDNSIRLDRRLTVHAGGSIPLSAELDLEPGLLFMAQGTYREFDIGTSFKYYLDQSPYHYRAVYVGAWMRLRDAGFVTVGLDYDDLKVGVSYDVNYSPLNVASRYRGGLELSLIYILRTRLPERSKFKSCPDFI